MKRTLEILVGVTVFVGVLALTLGWLSAHPGRLDPWGCHRVRAPYETPSRGRLPEGSYHCHRPLGTLRLDQLELVQEQLEHTPAPPPPAVRDPLWP